jgi:hypothetical protein
MGGRFGRGMWSPPPDFSQLLCYTYNYNCMLLKFKASMLWCSLCVIFFFFKVLLVIHKKRVNIASSSRRIMPAACADTYGHPPSLRSAFFSRFICFHFTVLLSAYSALFWTMFVLLQLRRERIAERMRALQELVPNTNKVIILSYL